LVKVRSYDRTNYITEFIETAEKLNFAIMNIVRVEEAHLALPGRSNPLEGTSGLV